MLFTLGTAGPGKVVATLRAIVAEFLVVYNVIQAKTYCGIQHTGASMSRLRTQAVQVPSYVEMEARTARSLSSARHVIQLRANHVEPGEFAYCSLQSCCLNRNCMLLT
ncbi:hypothetical protein PPTG_24891, partial [Phytophthora nicotianae INRA-310]